MKKKNLCFFSLLSLYFVVSMVSCLGPGIITSMSDVNFDNPTNPEERVDFSSPYSGDFLLANNEYWDGEKSTSTGPLPSIQNRKINEDDYVLPKGLPFSAYKVDHLPGLDFKFSKELLIHSEKNNVKRRIVGDTQEFFVKNFKEGSDEIITATLQAVGLRCEVWAHDTTDINIAMAEEITEEFDSVIWPKITSNFYIPSDVNSDGKISILIYDIQDDFESTGVYTGGYFWRGDLLDIPNSNRMEIFYIDTYPSMHYPKSDPIEVSKAFSTIVHEFQHMVNFNRNCIVEDGEPMSVWIDEGLSMAAEKLVYGPDELNGRLEYYNTSVGIKNGHSLTYWDYTGETLANYSLSYLFMQYLKIQINQGESVYKEIIEDASNDYKSIQNILNKYFNSILFGDFMTNWRIAIILKEDKGIFGFGGEQSFDILSTQIYTGSSMLLRGGGAILKFLSEDFEPAEEVDASIQFAGIN